MTEMIDPQPTGSTAKLAESPRRGLSALLLPIKDLSYAKQRLAAVLTPEERFGLARAMLADTMRAVQQVRHADKIFVVTSYAPAIEMALSNGWEVVREERQISESASVDFASRVCSERGVARLLRLPIDLPLLLPDDIDELLATDCTAPAVVMVPSRDGSGTNAILRTPPTLFPSHFGPDSFAKHQREAEQVGAQTIVRRNLRLEMDVDEESDLRALLQHDLSQTSTGKWLESRGVALRFRARAVSAQAPG